MRYVFHDCEIDLDRETLTVSGENRHVEPQVFQLLVHLVRNPDRLVSRDELVDVVWDGRIVSDAAIHARIAAARRAVGDDGKRQAVIGTVARRGIRFIGQVAAHEAEPPPRPAKTSGTIAGDRGIRFCQSGDGTRIAWTASGEGPPVLRAGHWLTHLEHDRSSPLWRPIIDAFGAFSTLVRYDARGNGLSQRAVDDLSVETLASDLLTVADAAGLDRFIVYGTSQGAPVALTFAARHPERVRGLVLHGGFARGRFVRSAEARAEGAAYVTLMRQGWGTEGSQFLQAFASIFVPDGSLEQLHSLAALQRIATDSEMAVRLRSAFDAIDVSALLPRIEVPTLVVHARNDGVHPLSESLTLASEIPNARILVLESRDHVLVPQEPAWGTFFADARRFIVELPV
ncbi:alpha/beta fold hydrolase (plasmid) [Acuticoccus sp. MNP-M23]|uniref:alpha/beta fold hydrolase n=1 Tax=Acuticoccus sp. MNP-M23 TaxID=3072793 RepID=UPI002815A54A|nr:alpha/beta fold hydrolase [Acuticoccus sp. MNP-M23]WMS45267.1 alpha/beta fold hydrolase [Acuticoccus sp. MNP-M23]